jgi:hypothetical protein
MDVVAVSTAIGSGSSVTAQSVEPGDHDYAFAHVLLHEFQLVVSSGDRSRIVVGISDERDPAQRAQLSASGMDRVIGAVRGMLRDKKVK